MLIKITSHGKVVLDKIIKISKYYITMSIFAILHLWNVSNFEDEKLLMLRKLNNFDIKANNCLK